MNFIKKIIFLSVFFIFLTFPRFIKGNNFDIPNRPNKIYPIQDYAKILSPKQINDLNNKLISYSNKTSTEILIPIVKNIFNNEANMIAQKWGEKWKIGKFYKNNGIVILLSIEDKKISIQNGYGLEPYMTDFTTKRIIKKIKPFLKKNLYYDSINFCTDEIYKVLNNKFLKEKHNQKKTSISTNFLLLITSIISIFILFFCLRENPYNSSLLNIFILTNFLKNSNNSIFEDDDNNFEGFGGGGHFGGGGSNEDW